MTRTIPFKESVICCHGVKVYSPGQSRVQQKFSVLKRVGVKNIVIRIVSIDSAVALIRA